jgi:hypothetical protein
MNFIAINIADKKKKKFKKGEGSLQRDAGS